MKYQMIFFGLISLVLSNCTSSYLIESRSTGIFLKTAPSHSGQIILKNGAIHNAVQIQVGWDSTSWRTSPQTIPAGGNSNASPFKVRTTEIRKIIFRNSSRGMFEGFGRGALVGTTLGLAFGMFIGAGEWTVLAIGISAGIASPILGGIGMLIGTVDDKDVFIIDTTEDAHQEKTQK